MATKKSSSAAKKKAAPKKQAAKKKSTSVKRPTVIEESAALYANDDSAQASLQSAASKSPNEKNESGNGIYLFLVLAGVAAIGYLGYAKYNSKKAEAPVVKVEEKPMVPATTTAPEEAAKAVSAKFAVEKIESGKKWDEAVSYCEKLGAKLPTKQELADFSKDAPQDLKTKEMFWAMNTSAKKASNGFVVSFKDGKSIVTPKSEKHKVLCKN